MASEKETDAQVVSDEGQERPIREQLKNTSINPMDPAQVAAAPKNKPRDGTPEQTANDTDTKMVSPEVRGRLQKKRSHEEVEDDVAQEDATGAVRQHTRKRSRDSTADEEALNNGQRKISGERSREDHGEPPYSAATDKSNGLAGASEIARSSTPETSNEKHTEAVVDVVSSPKTKRSRLHSAPVADDATVATNVKAAELARTAAKDDVPEPQEDGATVANTAAAKIPPGSGFANTSTTSPFGAFAGSKSPLASTKSSSETSQTSPVAFAASGFGALSGSSASGFGAVGKKSGGFGAGGSFATGPQTVANGDENAKPAIGGFGGNLGQTASFASAPGSNFGSTKTNFAKLGQSSGGFGRGSGFGSLAGAASGGLTSFASGKPSAKFGGSKVASAFGAPAEEDDEGEEGPDDDEQSGVKSPLSTEGDKQDERFYEQDLETGEEDEATKFSCRAKLFHFVSAADGKKEWRERGTGVVKLNVKKLLPDDDGKPQARFLMRADGSHRVVLNTPIKKELKFGTPEGDKPTGMSMYFMGTIAAEEGSEKPGLQFLQLKARANNTLELWENVTELQDEM